jgi:hypothetical protein
MPTGLFTNSKSRRDFIRNELEALSAGVTEIYIASAFFTEADLLSEIAASSTTIRLIVRLGFPTNPDALANAMKLKCVQIRYFSDSSFHPKLYIFGEQNALVGSANLTGRAVISNQEVMVTSPASDERFPQLAGLFSEYWVYARVLTDDILARYRSVYRSYSGIQKEIERLDDQVEQQIGKHAFPNIDRGLPAATQENVFLESYRRTYQECVAAFWQVKDVYLQVGLRKAPETEIPLRLEIDSFMSFVRDTYTRGESWKATPLGWNEQRRLQVRACVEEWHRKPWPHFEEQIVGTNYPRIRRLFESLETLMAASDDELFDGLLTVHSFHDRLRFLSGGLEGVRNAFIGGNDPDRIRNSLAYLVFGPGDLVARMADLIYSPEYRLASFRHANVQELVGWVNTQDLPVINGRTTKVLRYFGLNVQQLS